MSLSDKIVSDNRHPEYDVDVIRSEDVKEFIKALKDKIRPSSDYVLAKAFLTSNLEVIAIIDKLAGDELT